MKHTPGPWTCQKNSTAGRGFLVFIGPKHAAADLLHIGTCGGAPAVVATDEANAKLIAAAPELLAALQESLSWLDVIPLEYRNRPGYPATTIRKLLAKLQ